MPLPMHLMGLFDQVKEWKAMESKRAFKEGIHNYLMERMEQAQQAFNHSFVLF